MRFYLGPHAVLHLYLVGGKGTKDMAKKKVIAHTGHRAPVSGQYRPSGGRNEITLSKGDITPPNRWGSRQKFFLVDATKHQRKR